MASLLYVILFTFLLQHANGNRFDKHLDELRSLQDTINKISQDVEVNLAELQSKKVELEEDKRKLSLKLENTAEECKTENLLRHVELHKRWDVEACLNLTGDWKDGILVGLNISMRSLKIGELIWETTNKVMDCKEKNVFKEIPCYYSTGKELIKEIEELKQTLSPLIAQAQEVLRNITKDYNECVEVPNTLKDKIERNIKDC